MYHHLINREMLFSLIQVEIQMEKFEGYSEKQKSRQQYFGQVNIPAPSAAVEGVRTLVGWRATR
jgi:hypothetical protein